MNMIYGSCMKHAVAQTQSNSFKTNPQNPHEKSLTVIGHDREELAILSGLESKPLQVFCGHVAVGLLLYSVCH